MDILISIIILIVIIILTISIIYIIKDYINYKDNVNKFVELAKKDFSLLAKDYGMMCKNLVENPEQRTNFWEIKGNKKFK